MTESARYVKIIEWSEEDGCFVGSCPGLLYGGCHGEDEVAVFEQSVIRPLRLRTLNELRTPAG